MTATPHPETDMETTGEADPANDEELKKRLIQRLSVGAIILAGLIGSLMIFDSINTLQPPVPARVAASKPAPEPLAKAGEPQADAKESAKEPLEQSDKSAAPVAKAEESVPEGSASPDVMPLQALPGEKPLTKPASSRLAMLRPAGPTPPAASRAPPAHELARAKPAPGASADTSRAAEAHPASRPLSQAAERQFGLQLGVFSNVANAEELRARLAQSGIPASIEARVHAGPFASRAEADAARAKLKELGISDSLLITMKAPKVP